MATEDAPRSGPPMTELPPTAARSQEIAAEAAEAEKDENVVREEHQETAEPGVSGDSVKVPECWATGMALSVSADFVARGRVQGKLDDDEAGKLTAPILMRKVGWLDQRGRVWLEVPPMADFDGGSLTPLLIQLSYDD